MYIANSASGEAIPDYETGNPSVIRTEFLEASNVQVVEEMVRLITAQRAYELNSKAITTSDEMLQVANNLRR
jgi:flagellar basal-body rod protein FlgG